MTAYPKMTAEEWKAEYAEVTREYEELKARGLNLNMARGKPGKAQLDLVSDIFSLMQKPTANSVACPPPSGCSRRSWAAGRSRCSWAATPACS